MTRAAPSLVAVWLAGCVQIFDLDAPSLEDDDATPTDMSDPGEETTTPSTCAGVVYNGRCFERFDDEATWEEARKRCYERGMELAKIESAAVIAAVGKLLYLSDSPYIGASDLEVSGVYYWLDGTVVTTAGWLPTQPDGVLVEHCLTLMNVGSIGWNDETCEVLHDYICEYPTD